MQQKVSIQINHFQLPVIALKQKKSNLRDDQITNRTQALKRKLQKKVKHSQKKQENLNKQNKKLFKKLSLVQNLTLLKKQETSELVLPKLQKGRSRFQNSFQNKSIKQQNKLIKDDKKQLKSIKSSNLFNNSSEKKKKRRKQKRQSSDNMFDKIHNTLLQSKFHGIKQLSECKLSSLKIKEKINKVKKNMQKYKCIQSQKKIDLQTQLIPMHTKTQWKKIKVSEGSVIVNKSCLEQQIQQIDRLLIRNQSSLFKLLQNKKILVDMQLSKVNILKKIR